jgi:hypothetical protein
MLLASRHIADPEPPVDRLDSRWTAAWASLFLLTLIVRLVLLPITHNNTTDSWSRLHNAQLWLQHPTALPAATSSGAWLPLHFWLLGAVLWVIKSETAARVFTVLLGTLTVVLCASIWTQAFGRRIALASSLVLALFGFHIAFSITTSSEAPTIFFLAAGIYGWVRYASEAGWRWLLLSTLALNAASLCRFEAWLVPPVLSLTLLDFSRGWSSVFSNGVAWRKTLRFAVCTSFGAVGWVIFSFIRWGDPFELPHRTVWLNTHFRPPVLHHSLYFRLLTVPGSLLISLSPLVVALAALGLVMVIARACGIARGLALLVLILLGFNWWNSIRYEVTQARYTLLYSWLLIPFAFEALRWISTRWRGAASRAAFSAVIVFFVMWQAGIMLGAVYAPPSVADRLSALSPTQPLHHEMRGLTGWLKSNSSSYDTVILDDFNWGSPAVSRFGKLDPQKTFEISAEDYTNPAALKAKLAQFVNQRHPNVLICSPYGPIGRAWSIDDRKTAVVEDLGIQLDLRWQGEYWRIYTIRYRPSSLPASPIP